MKIKKIRLKKVRQMYCVVWQEGKREFKSSLREEVKARELKSKMYKVYGKQN